MGRLLCASALVLTLAACGDGEQKLNQTGPSPAIPDRRETLVPPMKIAEPTAWNGEKPLAPAGFTVTAFAGDLRIPRQMLVLPNGDILVAEGRGGGAPKLKPKDVLAGPIKAAGTTSVKGGNRLTLLRDADG
ncbi:MAG TPA: sorbosone dehydrogenase family protein, partial [Caulobacter sp.]|nr:sorbosone dehydrogenase family protein [Caulobacter sp.]